MPRVKTGLTSRYVPYAAALAVIVLPAVWHVTAQADRPPYVWSYSYATTPPEDIELEYYLTNATPHADSAGQTSWEHRVELEVGLTDRWDIALYQIFSQPGDGAFHYDAFQIRTRYRLGAAGRWPIDPLIYLEYRRPSSLLSANELEGKLVLSHDFDRVNVVVNLVEELEFAPGSESHTGYSFGMKIEPRPILSLGIEAFGDITSEEGTAHYLGPTVSLARGKWYYTIGAALGLNQNSDDVRARAILGIEL
ncbi:MAG: hypothetical protein HY304_01230 [candidate division Zixibacteria bacterium]|nr:hypothetical protein [candidate division Zixibacteria bacterium]